MSYVEYEYNDDSHPFFFHTNISRKDYLIKRDGEVVYKLNQKFHDSKKLVTFLENIGYKIIPQKSKDIGNHVSKTTIPIVCYNNACRFADEKKAGICSIKVKSNVELIKDSNKKVIDKNIVVTIRARDIQEMSTKTECLTCHVHDLIGLRGNARVYGKTEVC